MSMLNHPYIPNSDPAIQAKMLEEIGASCIEDFFKCIPQELRFKEKLDIPAPILSEAGLKRHVEGILSKNQTSNEMLSFLGGGCWNHHVPAICDEINGRSEFLTAYAGDPYEDHGRFQALFEYASMMAILLETDVVNIPTYDGSQAAGTSLRIACRITGRNHVLVSEHTNPDRLKVIKTYLEPQIQVTTVACDPHTGDVDMEDLSKKISETIAAVYIENPSFLGNISVKGQEMADAIHDKKGLFIVFTDPTSLGTLTPPSRYGADLTCGEIQPLGIHMHYGGGRGGFIASADREDYVLEYPSRLFGIAPTSEKEWGFGDVAWERTSFAKREEAKEFVGTAAALWGITAGVYLASMGPKGMQELSTGLMQRSCYLAQKISALPGVKLPFRNGICFKEFVVNFDGTNKKTAQINKALLDRGIFGGHDLSGDFPQLGQSALYSVTEGHTQADLDQLVSALSQILV